MKLSPAQRYQVDKLQGKTLMSGSWCKHHQCWNHNPYVSEQRTFDSLEAKGVMTRCRVEDGCTGNGYRLTELGETL